MVWFNLLKVQRQTQRQGFRLDDKDEDYVLEEEDDCLKKLVAYFDSKLGNSHFTSEKHTLRYHTNARFWNYNPTPDKNISCVMFTDLPDEFYYLPKDIT